EGETSDAAYIVLSGRLDVYNFEAGRRIVLRSLAAGDVFGETSIFAASRRTASVIVTEDAALTKITSDLIEEELTSMKPWMGAFVRTLAARFAGVEGRAPRPTASASPQPSPQVTAPAAASVASGGDSLIIDIDEPLASGDEGSDLLVTELMRTE